MRDEPTIKEMVGVLRERRWLPFASTSVMAILAELLERPLSKGEMKTLTNLEAQRAFLRAFESTEGDLIQKVFGKSKQGRDVIKYELTESGREFVLDQLELIKTFYKASGKASLKSSSSKS